MFENIMNFFKKVGKKEENKQSQENSKNAAKERLHLVLMQDRANVSADFLELMKQEIIDVIKKYIEVDEQEIDVRLTNKENEDGTNGAPALYANIPILNIKNDARKIGKKEVETENKKKQNDVEEKQTTEDKQTSEINNKKEKEGTKIEKENKIEDNNETEKTKKEKSINKKKQKENNKKPEKDIEENTEEKNEEQNSEEPKEEVKSKE